MKRQYQAKATKQKQQQQNLEATEAKQLRQAPVEFGPYLSDRQWATIREDLSADGSCWEFCDFHRSHRDPYLAGEDGLLGICDSGCRLCFAWGFWNGKDAFVKEKLFGLTGGVRAQGNHGEDVKEAYFYQLNSPSHDYMRANVSYDRLLAENAKRSVRDDEFEIYDTGVFDKGYWEICVEYARDDDGSGGGGNTVCVMTAKNCSDSESTLHALLPSGFRNTWNTVYSDSAATKRADKDQPRLTRVTGANKSFPPTVECRHPELPTVFLLNSATNSWRRMDRGILFTRNETEEKNAISRYLTAARHRQVQLRAPVDLAPGAAASVCVRLSNRPQSRPVPLLVLDWLPESYHPSSDLAEICRLAYSGLLWSKQYYEYRPTRYLKCREAAGIRNAFRWNPHGWEHLDNADILSMPDKWEFPWYASWTPVSRPHDENPPVLAWSAYEVFKSTGDLDFARRIYPRLKLNFAWWLRHRRVASQCSADDSESDAVYFKSGFLGMDNICAIDRSRVPDNCRIYQADAYAWVFATGLHCLRLAAAAGQSDSELCYWLDWLARLQRGFRHFDDAEGFCFDILEERGADGVWRRTHVRILSMVGLMPLTAVMDFDWSDLAGREAVADAIDRQWVKVFERLFPLREGPADCSDADEGFLGPYGVRMVSRWHRKHPVTLAQSTLNYEPGESRTGMYGGNSNWRGPVWLCMNYLLVQAALRVHEGGRPDPRCVALPDKSANECCQTAATNRRRPLHGEAKEFASQWRGAEFALFYEYFHGDTGRGCGASHQTGWTALVVKFAQTLHKRLVAE
uniref:Glyco_hydro_63 domain-containing protein n=1 Tax=Macrostomum lignano TaxID=282301 RepID=A0A1I8FGJ1_9PLAT